MASYVYFKFKSQKEPQRVTIDGPHTDVWNLKREIITISRLGDGTDFDLKIYKENSDEEYTDDTEIIPKDSTVLARRLPASAPGKGRAARYVSGKPPVSARHNAATASKAVKAIEMNSNMTEAEKLHAMLNFTDAQWQQKQEEMSHETRVPMTGKPFKKANVPEGEPPHGYICYRCGKKGHWIQACPTNDDANYDNRNRIKRTTGIPRSMLKKVDQADVDKLDDAQRQNLMVNAEGDYVFAQADEKAWKKHLEQVKASEAAQKKVQVGNKELQDRGLECPIDKRLFVDPMKTPCCGKTYCHECIENALLENDLTCPGCETENISLEALQADEEIQTKIKEYQADKDENKDENKDKGRSRSVSVAVESPKAEIAEETSSRDGSYSPPSASGQSKKRSASDAAESTASGKLGAPAMKRQKSGEVNLSSTPKPEDGSKKEPSPKKKDAESKQETPTENEESVSNEVLPENMMPPDMSQMMQGMNFPMMANLNPFAANPMMNMGMGMGMGMGMPMGMGMGMGMGMNGMPNMNGMNGMNFPPNMNMMNGMNGMDGMNMNMNNMFGNGNGEGFGNPNMNANQNGNQNWNRNSNFQANNRGNGGYNRPYRNFQNNANNHQSFNNRQQQQGGSTQPSGMTGVPTGPKSLQNTSTKTNVYPGTGAPDNKFSNQHRHVGNEEDNAYMRQPVNPNRHQNRNRRARQADYREL